MSQGFAIWITGTPASGKSTIAAEVIRLLAENYGVRIVHLESDSLRQILTPQPTYSSTERDWFYKVMTFLGQLMTTNGLNVLFDASANRRAYRDEARRCISRFLEVYVKCPMSVCMARDPKGIYRKAERGMATNVPGLQDIYEEPVAPECIVESDRLSAEECAAHVITAIKQKGWI